jgi:hypothetical protein
MFTYTIKKRLHRASRQTIRYAIFLELYVAKTSVRTKTNIYIKPAEIIGTLSITTSLFAITCAVKEIERYNVISK